MNRLRNAITPANLRPNPLRPASCAIRHALCLTRVWRRELLYRTDAFGRVITTIKGFQWTRRRFRFRPVTPLDNVGSAVSNSPLFFPFLFLPPSSILRSLSLVLCRTMAGRRTMPSSRDRYKPQSSRSRCVQRPYNCKIWYLFCAL